MADYPHLDVDNADVEDSRMGHILTVALSDGTVRRYPGDYEARPLDGQWLAIYRPSESTMPGFAIPVAGFRRNRVESFSYSGHEVYPVVDHDSGNQIGTVHDPLDLLGEDSGTRIYGRVSEDGRTVVVDRVETDDPLDVIAELDAIAKDDR